MSANHEAMKEQFEIYLMENDKLGTGIKASAARARAALQEISKSIKERRKEIMEEKAAI